MRFTKKKALLAIAFGLAVVLFAFEVPVIHVGESHTCGLPPSPNGCGCDYDESVSAWLFGIGYQTIKTCYVP